MTGASTALHQKSWALPQSISTQRPKAILPTAQAPLQIISTCGTCICQAEVPTTVDLYFVVSVHDWLRNCFRVPPLLWAFDSQFFGCEVWWGLSPTISCALFLLDAAICCAAPCLNPDPLACIRYSVVLLTRALIKPQPGDTTKCLWMFGTRTLVGASWQPGCCNTAKNMPSKVPEVWQRTRFHWSRRVPPATCL